MALVGEARRREQAEPRVEELLQDDGATTKQRGAQCSHPRRSDSEAGEGHESSLEESGNLRGPLRLPAPPSISEGDLAPTGVARWPGDRRNGRGGALRAEPCPPSLRSSHPPNFSSTRGRTAAAARRRGLGVCGRLNLAGTGGRDQGIYDRSS